MNFWIRVVMNGVLIVMLLCRVEELLVKYSGVLAGVDKLFTDVSVL